MDNGAASTRIVAQGVVYLRARATSDSEQVSQQWLGCRVRIIREDSGWAYIEGDDTYRGWADSRLLAPDPGVPLTTVTSTFAEVREQPDPNSPLLVRLPILAGVEIAEDVDKMVRVTVPGGKMTGYVLSSALTPLPTLAPTEIAAYAAQRGRDLRGTPYLWGGSTPFGTDCSGFVQLAYRLAGIILRRDADIQRTDTRFIRASLNDPRAGDLVFFGTRPDKITHVGMMLGDGTYIHAASGSGVIVSPVGDDRYWPRRIDGRRLEPTRARDPIVRHESEQR